MCRVCVFSIARDLLTQLQDVNQIPVYVKCCNPFHTSQGTQYASIIRIFFKFCVGKYFLLIARITLYMQKICASKVRTFYY
jgi:hypothetical protein